MTVLPIATRHRSLALLAGVVVAQVLLLAVQIRTENQVRLIRVWTVSAAALLQEPVIAVVDRVGAVWNGYVSLRHTRQENENLRAEISAMRLRVTKMESQAGEARRLAALLEFRESYADLPMLAARVIGNSATGGRRTVTINRGTRDFLAPNLGVITPEGVVGKILEVYEDTSQVLLLVDRDSGVGSLLESTRTQGVVRGTGEPEATMNFVINDENVAVGERILTSGQDRIFPKDLPVGAVSQVQPGNPFKQIRVRPAARLDRLEEVIVLLSKRELAPSTTSGALPSAPVASAEKQPPSP